MECPRELFARAIANHTSSPSYVLVTVVSGAMQRRVTVCIPAPALLIAIRDELGLHDDAGGNAKAEQFAMEREQAVFHFGTRKAWKRAAPAYDQDVLQDVEERVKGLSTEQLRDGVAQPGGPLHEIYRASSDWPAYRDALAHVLLEHCVAVRLSERGGLEPGFFEIELRCRS
jgi:hypothetical protein